MYLEALAPELSRFFMPYRKLQSPSAIVISLYDWYGDGITRNRISLCALVDDVAGNLLYGRSPEGQLRNRYRPRLVSDHAQTLHLHIPRTAVHFNPSQDAHLIVAHSSICVEPAICRPRRSGP